MKHYRAIFFDWDDTLGDWSSSSKRAHRVLYERYGWASLCGFNEWLTLYRQHNNDLWDAYARGLITREFLHTDQFLYPICQLQGGSTQDADALLRDRCRRMGDEYIQLTNNFFRLRPHAREVVTTLAERYPLTVVSNGYVETQYYKLERSGLRKCFTHTVFSEEAGVAKPDPRIMLLAVERNRDILPDLQPSDVLMVGDSLSTDIAAATAAGIDSVWLDSSPRGASAPEAEAKAATYTIHSLRELRDITG